MWRVCFRFIAASLKEYRFAFYCEEGPLLIPRCLKEFMPLVLLVYIATKYKAVRGRRATGC